MGRTSRKGIFLILIALSGLFLMSSLLNIKRVEATSSSAPLTSHDGIAIHSDSEFTVANGVVSGSGTAMDPYLIENWDIDVQSHSVPVPFDGTLVAGVLIANTTSHVVIQNVRVRSFIQQWFLNMGIVLWNTTNVVVESSRVFNGNHGVLLIGANKSTIEQNEFFNQIEPVAIAGGFPSESLQARENIVAHNNIHDAQEFAIGVFNASDNLITANSISNTSGDAALFDGGANGNVFSGNNITSTGVGIRVDISSLNNTIVANSFDVQFLGIGVGYESNGTAIKGNDIDSLHVGIDLLEVSNSIVSGNTIRGNETGIRLSEGATANLITRNIVVAHDGIFVCGTRVGLNRVDRNDLNGSDRPIVFCR